MSPALRVALSIAVMRAPCSLAAFSSSARIDLDREIARQQLGQDLVLVRLEFVDRAAQPSAAAAAPASGGGDGISCCAVTIWVIADWKRL